MNIKQCLISLPFLLVISLSFSQELQRNNEFKTLQTSTCELSFQPELLIINKSDNRLKDISFEMTINGSNTRLIQWFGNLKPGETDKFELPAYYVQEGIKTLQLSIKNEGGQNSLLGNIDLEWANSFSFSECLEDSRFVWGVQTTNRSAGELSKEAFEKEGITLDVKGSEQVYNCPNCNEETELPELNLWTHMFRSDRQIPETGISFDRGLTWIGGLWVPQSLQMDSDSVVYLATMESELASFENMLFLDIEKGRVSAFWDNSESVNLNNDEVARVQNNNIGPSKILKIEAFQSIKSEVEVYVMKPESKSESSNHAALIFAIASTLQTGGLPMKEQGVAGNSALDFTSALTAGFNFDESDRYSGPAINYILFNDDFEFIKGGFKSLEEYKDGQNYILKLPEIEFDSSGYVYFFLSNTGDSDAYFNDFRIVHTIKRY